MSDLQLVALGFALGDADHKVREEGGENRGPRVRLYLANTVPPINTAAPWCAAWVQYVTDRAAAALKIPNPLDAVKLEAYVQSYFQWAEKGNRFVETTRVALGDLVLYKFGSERYDHIGIVLTPPDIAGRFTAIEGNTNDAGSREGDGVFVKGDRTTRSRYPVRFVRWALPS